MLTKLANMYFEATSMFFVGLKLAVSSLKLQAAHFCLKISTETHLSRQKAYLSGEF